METSRMFKDKRAIKKTILTAWMIKMITALKRNILTREVQYTLPKKEAE